MTGCGKSHKTTQGTIEKSTHAERISGQSRQCDRKIPSACSWKNSRNQESGFETNSQRSRWRIRRSDLRGTVVSCIAQLPAEPECLDLLLFIDPTEIRAGPRGGGIRVKITDQNTNPKLHMFTKKRHQTRAGKSISKQLTQATEEEKAGQEVTEWSCNCYPFSDLNPRDRWGWESSRNSTQNPSRNSSTRTQRQAWQRNHMIQAKLWTKSKIPECEWRQFQEKVIRIWDNLTDPGGISRVHSQVGNNCIAGAHFVRARFDIFLVPILLCRWWSLCSFRSFISNQSTQVGETNSIITVITHDNYQIKMWNQEKKF